MLERKCMILSLFLFLFVGQIYGQDFSLYQEEIPGSDQAIEMVPVEGGTFLMGSPADEPGRGADEGPQRKVKVNSFWMGKYEITWQQYDLFVKEEIQNISNKITGGNSDIDMEVDAISLPTPPYTDMTFGMGREGYPAINMTQYAAVMFAKWLSAQTGNFYRLPTEAEWEYACRAETNSAYSFGGNPDTLDKYAWFEGNSNRKYHQVGKKTPNAFGLYDMHGNVAEWTMDQYKEDYFELLEGSVAENPWFKPETLYPRSVRGGSWQDESATLRCAERRGSEERWKQRDPQLPKSDWWLTDASFVGFRLIRPENPPPEEEIEKYWIEAIEDI